MLRLSRVSSCVLSVGLFSARMKQCWACQNLINLTSHTGRYFARIFRPSREFDMITIYRPIYRYIDIWYRYWYPNFKIPIFDTDIDIFLGDISIYRKISVFFRYFRYFSTLHNFFRNVEWNESSIFFEIHKWKIKNSFRVRFSLPL